MISPLGVARELRHQPVKPFNLSRKVPLERTDHSPAVSLLASNRARRWSAIFSCELQLEFLRLPIPRNVSSVSPGSTVPASECLPQIAECLRPFCRSPWHLR